MSYESLAKEKQTLLIERGHATVLAIETSCDETACAIVKDGREVLSNVVHTQIPLHRKYGGVVLMLMSRTPSLGMGAPELPAIAPANIIRTKIKPMICITM